MTEKPKKDRANSDANKKIATLRNRRHALRLARAEETVKRIKAQK
jgi:hypothetical protein